tara:strand:- start:487 stop:1050 length:564 start_codon:yes stop_codon:yes gene_type:complete
MGFKMNKPSPAISYKGESTHQEKSNLMNNNPVVGKASALSNAGSPLYGYVKEGGKATGNMKDYKLNSQARRDEYTARGWKQDDTTKVTVAKQKVKAPPSTISIGIKKTTVSKDKQSSSSDDISTRKGRKKMKNSDKASGEFSRKEIKSRKIQRKAQDAADKDPNSKRAIRLKKRESNRKERLAKNKK